MPALSSYAARTLAKVAGVDASNNVGLFTTAGIRETLSADRTYYVRTDGSDGNTGLADSAGGAWLTWQYAWDFVSSKLDIGPYTVTVQCGGSGLRTFTAGVSFNGPSVGGGSGQIQFFGDVTTPSNVVFATGSDHCIQGYSGLTGYVSIGGFKFTANAGFAAGVAAFGPGATIKMIYPCEFGSVTGPHFWVESGNISIEADYSVTGDCFYHYLVGSQGVCRVPGAQTVTITGARTVTTSWAEAYNMGFIGAGNGMTITLSGGATVTGKRYDAQGNGTIYTNGGGANFFPGNSAGTTSAGGQYI